MTRFIIPVAYALQKKLCEEGPRSTAIHSMRCCYCLSRFNVHLRMDGITSHSLDSSLDWTDGASKTSNSSTMLSHILVFQGFMSGVFVIYQVTNLYVADW